MDVTSTPCCLSSSCWYELVDVSKIRGVCCSVLPSPLRLLVVSPKSLSSEWGFNLYLFSPCCSTDPLIGVSSYLSLFLALSSLRGVCNTGISGTFVCVEGPCPFDASGWSAIVSCSKCSTSLPLYVPVGGVLSWAGCCEVVADDMPAPMCWGNLKGTYPKESRSSVFSSPFISFSNFSSSVISSTNVPSTHSCWLAYCWISGILWWTYQVSLFLTLL